MHPRLGGRACQGVFNGSCGMELSNRQKGDELVAYFPAGSCRDVVAGATGSGFCGSRKRKAAEVR